MAHAINDANPGAEPGLSARVLLVDDQPELRRLFARTLTKKGHDVVAAASAAAAIDLLRDGEFDLVISDVQMPDISGVELLRRIHERDPDLPVLLLSGMPDLETAMQAVQHGAFEYLTKPVSFEKLGQSVRRALAKRREGLEAKEALEQYRSGERIRVPRGSFDRASWTGELLGGRYRIGRLLGSGGMGSVYEATREDLGQMRVAVKVLHESLAGDPSLLLRFRREAETVGAIEHPNIVTILDFQARPDEPAFLVMELLNGISLRQALATTRSFSAERAVFIAFQMLAALSAVHRARVIHRDIKPDNVFLTSVSGLGDIVKLLDFGVAKVLTAPPGETLTQVGTVLGTPTYMAPEHARGAPIDARSDIYSVAALMYEMLGGCAPFSGDNYNALLFAIQAGKPAPLEELRSDLDPELVGVIRQAMSVDPAARYQTAEEMADALRPWLSFRASTELPPESSPLAYAPTVVATRPRPVTK